jgi:hypothetical protein
VTGDRIAGVVAIMMMLVLVGSSLTLRRLAMRAVIKMVLAWLVIFAVVLGAVAFLQSRGAESEGTARPRPDLT